MRRPDPRRPILDERDRRILALAVPALGALAVEPLYVLVDTAIVGRIGTPALGGLALAATVLSGVAWCSNFLSYGTTTDVARSTGRGDTRAAIEVATTGLWLAGALGVVLAALLFGIGPTVAHALGGRGHVLAAARTYLRISVIGVPFLLLALVGHGYLRGCSDTTTPLRVVLVANVVNITLELLFVYLFHWGVAGSAWGTVVAQGLTAAWFMTLVTRVARREGAALVASAAEAGRLLLAGRHLVVRTLAIVAAFTLATSVAARLGPAALGAHQITMQVFLLVALSVDALAVAAQAMVGTSSGAGDDAEAGRVGARVLRLGVLVGVGLAVTLIVTSPILPRLFTSDHAVATRATVALLFLGVMQVPAAIAFVLDGVLMGIGAYRTLQWVTVVSLAGFMPFAGLVLEWHRLGLVGLWGGLGVWMTARAVLNHRSCRRLVAV